MYYISPNSFAGVFAVPSELADTALKTVSGSFLKVILCIFRRCYEPITPEKISKHTGVPVGEVGDALIYWTQKGLLSEKAPVEEVSNAVSNGLPDENPTGDSDRIPNGLSNGASDEKPDGNSGISADDDISFTEENAENIPEKTGGASVSVNTGVSADGSEGTAAKADTKPRKTTAMPGRLSYEIICKRINESENVRTLFSQAQTRLGRTIGTGDQSSLLLLHDYFGLPVEVILALCEYASVSGKGGNMNYIYTLGVDWSKREIDTLEEADEEFKRIQAIDKNWAPFCKITGIKKKKPTAKQSEFLSVWIDRFHFTMEMLSCAYDEMSKHTDEMSFPYMNKILTQWYNAGVDTPEKVRLHEEEFTENMVKAAAERAKKKKDSTGTSNGSTGSSGISGTPASYDIEKAQQKAKASVPTLKKKEKR